MQKHFLQFFFVVFFLRAVVAQEVYKIEYGADFCGYLESIQTESPQEIKMWMKSFFINIHEEQPVLLQQSEIHLFNTRFEPVSLQVIRKTPRTEKKYLCAIDPKKIVVVEEENNESFTTTLENNGQKIWPNMFVIARYLKMYPIETEVVFPFFDLLTPKIEYQLEVKKLGVKMVKTDLGDIDCFHYRLVFKIGEGLRTQTLLLSQKDYTLVQFIDFNPKNPRQSTRIQITNDTVKTEAQSIFQKMRQKNQPKDLTWFLNKDFHYEFFYKDQLFGTHSFLLKKGNPLDSSYYLLDSTISLKTPTNDLQSTSTTTYSQTLFPLQYQVKSSAKQPKLLDLKLVCEFRPSEIKVEQTHNEVETKRLLKSPENTGIIDNYMMGHFAMLCTKVELEEGAVTEFQLFHPFMRDIFSAKIKVLDEVVEKTGTSYLCDFLAEPFGKIRLVISSKHELLEFRQNFETGQMIIRLKK